MIIAYPAGKRKPYFINKPLIPRKYYTRKEALHIKRVCLYLTLFAAFILGCHEGFVALWDQTRSSPVEVYPLQVNTLPPADQALLRQGIPIRSREQLQHSLEDYLS